MPDYHFVENLETLLPEVPADSIISRAVHKDAAANVTLFGFAAGQELTEHTAARPAVLHILSGQARLTLGAETLRAGPGTWVQMPAHLPHSIQAETGLTMILYLLSPVPAQGR